ncbi:MAG: undecaprenyl-diphosphate phosphatase [Armatimonadetes bacterium]|nr:undecaprenyl-diphosphate phosphatase [Armatimonadota bacterium]
MPLHEALALGVLQGLTEFLPVSSSGHLVIIPAFLGWAPPGLQLAVAVHFGTLLAVVAYYWRDWLLLLGAGMEWLRFAGRRPPSTEARIFGLLLLATVPAAVVGLALAQPVEMLFNEPALAGGALLVTGLFLFAADVRTTGNTRETTTGWRHALAVGVAQAVAVVPGISRSGATIVAGLFAGLEREWATRFAFLLSVPVIFGAAVKEIPEAVRIGVGTGELDALIAGTAAAFVSGWGAIHLVIRAVRNKRLRWFAVYCWALGLVTLACHCAGLLG